MVECGGVWLTVVNYIFGDPIQYKKALIIGRVYFFSHISAIVQFCFTNDSVISSFSESPKVFRVGCGKQLQKTACPRFPLPDTDHPEETEESVVQQLPSFIRSSKANPQDKDG